VPAKTTVLGEPAIDLKERKLQLASMTKLPEMRKQVKQLLKRAEMEREILKKATAFFAQESQ